MEKDNFVYYLVDLNFAKITKNQLIGKIKEHRWILDTQSLSDLMLTIVKYLQINLIKIEHVVILKIKPFYPNEPITYENIDRIEFIDLTEENFQKYLMLM